MVYGFINATTMVYGTYNYSIHGVYKPTFTSLGGPTLYVFGTAWLLTIAIIADLFPNVRHAEAQVALDHDTGAEVDACQHHVTIWVCLKIVYP